MLRILERQLTALGLLAQKNFVEQMVEHLLVFTPHHAQTLGPGALRQVIQLGIERAESYGYTLRGPVRFYIELMFQFGSDFDTDPQSRWATAFLKRPWVDGDTERARVEELFFVATRYLAALAGPRNQYALDALRRAVSGGLDFAPDAGSDLTDQILQHLRYIAPEKCSLVGREGLESLIQHGLSAARARGGQTAADQSLVVVLMFGLGHGCLTDPQFPWIRSTLERGASHPEPDVFRNLRRRSQIYLQHTLDSVTSN
jgi:hypothetical protein